MARLILCLILVALGLSCLMFVCYAGLSVTIRQLDGVTENICVGNFVIPIILYILILDTE